MNTYNRYDISKIAILEVFILKEDHQLRWTDLARIYNVASGTDKEKQLAAIIDDLTNKRILERLPAATWKIVDVDSAQKALIEFIHGNGLPDLKLAGDLINPALQKQSHQVTAPRVRSRLTVLIWLVIIIAAILAIYKMFR
jgi:hypothetical protein